VFVLNRYERASLFYKNINYTLKMFIALVTGHLEIWVTDIKF